MSQDYTDDCFDPSHAAQTDMANIEKNFSALKSAFSGTSQPSNVVPGMWWLDTNTHRVKIRNETNSAWLEIWNMQNNKPVITNLSNDISLNMMAVSTKDQVAGTASLRTLGPGGQQACPGNDGRLSDARAPTASSVSQSKLKTATGSTSVYIGTANTEGETGVLPGGEYGFRCRVMQNSAFNYSGEFKGLNYKSLGTSYTAAKALFYNHTELGTYYAQERYVQASGEVHWIFNLRNRKTGIIEKAWQAPDHCCFGNGDDPKTFQHPFGNYDQDKYELIVVNPPLSLAKKINAKAGKSGEFLEIIQNEYEIDELSCPEWPKENVTVGLPGDWEEKWMTGESIKPLKSAVPKPKQAVTRVLKKKKKK